MLTGLILYNSNSNILIMIVTILIAFGLLVGFIGMSIEAYTLSAKVDELETQLLIEKGFAEANEATIKEQTEIIILLAQQLNNL